MAPHSVYRCAGQDSWVAIACRDDHDWKQLKRVIGTDAAGLHLTDPGFADLSYRLDHQRKLDDGLGRWCIERSRWDIESALQAVGVPAAAVTRPSERIDGDVATGAWGLWPMVEHPAIGGVRVDGQPVRFSSADWSIDRAAPTLGQDNQYVIGELLGRSPDQIEWLESNGII